MVAPAGPLLLAVCKTNVIISLSAIYVKIGAINFMKKEAKTAAIMVRITPTLKEAATHAASLDQRTLTSLIEKLLTDHCREQGLLPEDERPAPMPKKPGRGNATE